MRRSTWVLQGIAARLAATTRCRSSTPTWDSARRSQLRYILPLAVAETRELPASADQPAQTERLLGGLGESLFGLKYRFYKHTREDPWIGMGRSAARHTESTDEPPTEAKEEEGELEPTFSASLFPQAIVNNPTRSVARGIVEPGPDFLLSIEVAGRIGWLRCNGEVGYYFANSHLPQSWVTEFVAGRQFGRSTEGYMELYDIQDTNRIDDEPKQRQTTMALGGRQVQLRGRLSTNSQPGWIAYAGIRFLVGPLEKLALEVRQKQPGEDR